MDTKRMYKAENIDTDKALKAIDKSRVMQERASHLRSEKERSYMEGLNKWIGKSHGKTGGWIETI